MNFFKSIFNSQQHQNYSENATGKFADTAWSNKEHKKITDEYFPQMHSIEEDWSFFTILKTFLENGRMYYYKNVLKI